MNAIEQLYRNSGLVTEDNYIKVRDGLWIASSPYEEQYWDDADKSILIEKGVGHEYKRRNKKSGYFEYKIL